MNFASRPTPRILLVDDNPAIHQDYRKVLAPETNASAEFASLEAIVLGESTATASLQNIHFEIDSAVQGQQGLTLLKKALAENRPYSVAFVDMRMDPGWNGIETIKHLWQAQPTLQVVLCSAYSDYSWKEIVNELGTSDSLVILRKPFDNVEVLQLALSLSRKYQTTHELRAHVRDLDRMVAERSKALAEANEDLIRHINQRTAADERFRAAFETTPLPMCVVNLRSHEWVDCNVAFTEVSGWDRVDLLSQSVNCKEFWAGQPATLLKQMGSRLDVIGSECRFRNRSGEERIVLLSRKFLHLQDQPHALIFLDDITLKRAIEEQNRQGMKLEAIGRLAAGVAHDFNNILTVIKGHASLLLGDEQLPAHAQRAVEQMADATKRATGLVRQLLAFGRQQLLAPRPVDIVGHIEQQGKMMCRLIGERIQLRFEGQSSMPATMVDPGSLDQILLNLVVNARDAMPEGGSITVSCSTARVDHPHCVAVQDARTGDYNVIRVTDTGTGIPAEIQPRIFEPFFSTKQEGGGTGLGLATVHGLIRQQKGWIELENSSAAGTTFAVYLPQTTVQAERPAPVTGALTPSDWKIGNGRSALIVEDDETIRSMLLQLLGRFGFKILDAANAAQALDIWQQRQADIELVITDVVMPGKMSGLDLGQRITADRPGVKIIYCTGYGADIAGSTHTLTEGVNFLPKPYDAPALMQILNRLFPKPGKPSTRRMKSPASRPMARPATPPLATASQ